MRVPPPPMTPPESEPSASPVSRRNWLATAGATLLASRAGAAHHAAELIPIARPHRQEPEELARWMRLASVPGVSWAELEGGVLRTGGAGVRVAGASDAVTADTVFEAASLSKPVFAYLVMLLVGDNVLDLDRPLGEYLPLPNPDDARAAPITARHVLSHTGGWRNWRTSREHVLTADFEPGARFSYSGEGFVHLQRVVERVTGKAVGRLSQERVFGPLGMTRTAWTWTPALDGTLVRPHTNRGQPIESGNVRIGRAFHDRATKAGRAIEDWTAEDGLQALPAVDAALAPLPVFLAPNVAGSLLTTAADYGAFLRHLLSPAARAPRERMLTERVRINEALGWGQGVGLEEAGGRRWFWQWGDNNGIKNIVLGDAAAGRALAVFTNGQAGLRVYERVVRARTAVDHPLFLWV
jgi:CubicO group peptidase (beta-lactamase class C family)